MKSGINKLLAILVVGLAWCSSAYAGCTNATLAGTWEVVFADGNSCRLVLDKEGGVLIDELNLSVCFDPFRGTTAPDEGSYGVTSDCAVNFNLVVEGLNVQMYGRLTEPRNIGAGFFVAFVPDVYSAKGSFNLVRVE
jgi:hypothetical protein